jgi:hypothetical protein
VSFLLGLVLWSLNPWFQKVLEGRQVWTWLQARLRQRQLAEWRSLRDKLMQISSEAHDFRDEDKPRRSDSVLPRWRESLRKARIQGQDLLTPLQTVLSDDLQTVYKEVEELYLSAEEIPFSKIKELQAALENELKVKSADRLPELNRLQLWFKAVFEYARDRAQSAERRVWSELRSRFPDDMARVGPTRMANLTEVHREYGLRRYGLDAEAMWLRLLRVARDDATMSSIVDEARIQMSFSVAMTVTAAVTTGAWLAPSCLGAASLWPFIAVGVLGPLLTAIFYGTVVQSYQTFAEAVRTAVDLHRFDLLRALHVKLPADSAEERKLWQRLMDSAEDQTGGPLIYEHPKPTAAKRKKAEAEGKAEDQDQDEAQQSGPAGDQNQDEAQQSGAAEDQEQDQAQDAGPAGDRDQDEPQQSGAAEDQEQNQAQGAGPAEDQDQDEARRR